MKKHTLALCLAAILAPAAHAAEIKVEDLTWKAITFWSIDRHELWLNHFAGKSRREPSDGQW